MSESVAAAGLSAGAEKVRRRMLTAAGLRAYFLAKLPLALFAGLKVRTLTAQRCEVTVPYGWRSTNPFRSTYFAAQAMAAELSTGALTLLAVESAGVPVSMLVGSMTATFEKKATETLTFTCEDGDRVFAAVRETVATGEGVTAELSTVGTLPDGTVAARFTFVWSLKKKTPRP
ncbi:MAG TPA: DUF4442 domain-containing protein [Longimicrobiaceae bacterium]|jgi:hypothetical protein|nr:DUF4442 domain-containing protein [Longimicrobiaceae bacterium]